MKKINGIFVVLSLLLLVSSTESSASSGPDNMGNKESATVIHLIERAQDFTFQDLGTPGPSLGDRLIFTSDLFDSEGRKVGRDGADCVTVRLDPTAPPSEQQIVQCTVTVELSNGQISFQGLAQGTENVFAVTGGTGAYATARGEALTRDIVPLQEADITITLFP